MFDVVLNTSLNRGNGEKGNFSITMSQSQLINVLKDFHFITLQLRKEKQK